MSMSLGWYDVSELWPPMGQLFIPQMFYEYLEASIVEWRWQGKSQELREKPGHAPYICFNFLQVSIHTNTFQ